MSNKHDYELQAILEILSQNRKDLQTYVARIKQTIGKVLDQDKSLVERVCTLFRKHRIAIVSILTTLPLTISTIVLDITGAFGEREGAPAISQQKYKGAVKKRLRILADSIKRCSGKVLEALLAIAGNIFGFILSFLGKSVGFLAEHIFALIVFVAGIFEVCLIQKVKNQK